MTTIDKAMLLVPEIINRFKPEEVIDCYKQKQAEGE